MTLLEKTYRDNIGRLFVYRAKEWDHKDKQWKTLNVLVMVSDVVKNGGWFHYVSEILKRDTDITPNAYTSKGYTTPCKEFHRQSLPATLSLLGDTWKKEVA